MFESLPQHFRDYGLKADVRTIMLLRKSIAKGLASTVGDLFLVLKGLVTNDPKDYGPFTTAFYKYFLEIDIKTGESLDQAILRSEVFKKWRDQLPELKEEQEEPDVKDLVDQFLNEVHQSSYDIQELISGKDILQHDDPNMADNFSDMPDAMQSELQKMADYNGISIEELLERMRQVAKNQKRRHSGGQHWIGQGGISPYGNSGAAAGGIRVGGTGGGKMARMVIGNANFYPVDTKQTLQDNNIDVALSYLKGIQDESAEVLLDIPKTIVEGVKEGGLFLPYEKEKINQRVQVILLIDNGGWSMTPFIKNVTRLFSKMKRRFAHDLKTYYYHNTIYGGAYSDERRTQFDSLEKILKHHKNYSLFIIGDADMAPYELSQQSIGEWQKLHDRFPRTVWLNPLDERFWEGSYTINILQQVIPMFPLSPHGIEQSIELMNRKRKPGRVSDLDAC